MVQYRDIGPQDKDLITCLMDEFYHSDAVCEPVPAGRLEGNVAAMMDGENTACRGVLFTLEEEPAGYLMLTTFYSGEAAGICVMIEQVFVCASCRGRGVGRQMMDWIRENYPHAKRFQLEVSEANPGAYRLYERCGFILNPYQSLYINI